LVVGQSPFAITCMHTQTIALGSEALLTVGQPGGSTVDLRWPLSQTAGRPR
jgi:hypothetical protein